MSALPQQECDVVMKGGITSGVVYPGVLFELAKKYRFRSIGGASAGAIAAGAAAAAEYGRQNGNSTAFEQLDSVSEELSTGLLGLFQPAPALEPLFALLIAGLKEHDDKSSKALALFGVLTRHYRVAVVIGLLPAVAIGVAGALTTATTWATAIAVLCAAVLGVACSLAVRLFKAVNVEIPCAGFGVCSGASTNAKPALMEWLHAQIQALAGRGPGDPPVTFGDLFGEGGRADPNIQLLVMTTSLTHQRPFQIPFRDRDLAFRPEQFASLFPADVVNHMVAHSHEVDDDHRWLPEPEQFPIVVACRMSLSFPALLSAVPLWARDFTHKSEPARQELRPVWMSDGGICSNFPIHFFDSVWPSRPTFGINLTAYDPDVHRDSRVYLPTGANQGLKRPFNKIGDMVGFGWSIIKTMQDWRDVTQTTLPGYRERIVQIALSKQEGGINLTMPPDRVRALAEYGTEAGESLTTQFDFAAHRWRRHLVWMACLERLLEKGHTRYAERPVEEREIANDASLPWHDRALSMGLKDFIETYGPQPGTYDQDVGIHDTMTENLERVMDAAGKWRHIVKYDERGRMTNIPRPPVEFRLVPSDTISSVPPEA